MNAGKKTTLRGGRDQAIESRVKFLRCCEVSIRVPSGERDEILGTCDSGLHDWKVWSEVGRKYSRTDREGEGW